MTNLTAEAEEDLMQLTRRALEHQQQQTTDLTDSVLHMPIEAYTDEARYSAEKDRIFKTLPLALALSLELPEPGDYKTIFALDTPVLMVRGDDGVVRAFLNVCRHRGARVCESDSGNARNFPCPYHAWTYGRQGELVTRYAGQLFGDVDEENLGLTSLGCAEASGIIWVTLNASESIDIDGWLGGMKTRLDTLKLDEWHLYAKRELPGPGWKVTLDGYLEIYHHNVVHGATVGQHTIGNLLVLDTYGPHQRLTLGRKSLGSLKETPEEEWQPLEHIRLVHNCFPNLSISGILGDHCLVSQIFPGEKPDTTVTVQMVLCAHKPETKEDIAAAENFSAMVLQAIVDEDYRLGMLIQQGIKSGANSELLFGKNEPAAQNYHHWVAHFMEQKADMNWGA